MWSKQDLYKLDKKYAELGVPHHQRPLRAAMELLAAGFSMGFGGNPEVSAICKAYNEILPEGIDSWPGAGVGLCTSVDRVRKVTLPVMFGMPFSEEWEFLGFEDREKWFQWCRGDLGIASQTCFAAADLVDFIYGVKEVKEEHSSALDLWQMSRSFLEDIANGLPTSFTTDGMLQPISLVAELAMKGTLVCLGVDASTFGRRGGFGHDLGPISQEMAKLAPHRDDALVAEVVAQMPDFVQSRYKAQGLTRLKVAQLALGAQFVAGSALRRLGGSDMASEMEVGGWPAPRRPFFS